MSYHDRSVCPNCKNALKPGAVGCPECGADEHTGWKDDATSEHPEVAAFDSEDYSDLQKKEFGPSRRKFSWRPLLIGFIIALLIAIRFARAIPK